MIPFSMYLHGDDFTLSDIAWFEINAGSRKELLNINPEDFGEPFYEVTLKCLYDLTTKTVTIIGAEL